MKKRILLLAIITSLTAQPKLTVVIIIDSFAAYQIDKLNTNLHYGLRTFLDKGAWFTHALYPHANPITAPGHASLSTGTLPKDHGIVGTSWFKNGKKIAVKNTAPQSLLQSTINDIFIKQNKNNHAFALSIKNYAALLTAGKRTPAIWFETKDNQFHGNNLTKETEHTLNTMNTKLKKMFNYPITWRLAYENNEYYTFPHINNYSYAFPESFINKTIKNSDPNFSEIFIRSPITNKLLFNAAEIYLKNVMKENPQQILLWISLNSLDQVTHYFGPQSKEAIDTIYHLDRYIQEFMNEVSMIISPRDTLYVLTADHGFIQIPEFTNGKSFHAPTIKEQINKTLEMKYGYSNLIKDLRTPFVHVNHEQIKTCNSQIQQSILADIQLLLKKHPAIAKMYKVIDFIKKDYKIGSKKWLFKNLIHPSRSGDFIFKVARNTLLRNEKNKTVHNTPYQENLHVPLIFYHPNKRAQKIETQVWTPQLTATLASILNITLSHQSLPPLPIATNEYKT
ncbi:TPA: hypothetical protein DIC20_01765 [Candidatus Dependentiae bacterium]|nr:MAG: Alkaline phosphomonoesterase [candidate division TM6 bacterium GW2011_GWF2_36_131]KKQ03670.1 MAG: Alkaline phosphomonoesterase [candidate division TM6 bacterium GW2011_GWE2_36_25]HBR70437.1 hypothetical protein [Candidatus Dependentiae bacterium]HCU00413.1 hypothetical protein [Candidatus Dependentiae bacterium]